MVLYRDLPALVIVWWTWVLQLRCHMDVFICCSMSKVAFLHFQRCITATPRAFSGAGLSCHNENLLVRLPALNYSEAWCNTGHYLFSKSCDLCFWRSIRKVWMGLSFKYPRLTDLKPYLAANRLVKTLEIKIKSNTDAQEGALPVKCQDVWYLKSTSVKTKQKNNCIIDWFWWI